MATLPKGGRSLLRLEHIGDARPHGATSCPNSRPPRLTVDVAMHRKKCAITDVGYYSQVE